MISFSAPLWLLGLALVPVIYWLHRTAVVNQSTVLAHLQHWPASDPPGPANGKRSADPAWRRRALLTALLVLALAGPRTHGNGQRVTLWVDDSVSMLTKEAGETRLGAALAQAQAEVAAASLDSTVRTLSDPWRDWGPLTTTVATAIAAQAGKEPAKWEVALLSQTAAHWLVTDTADPAVLDWPGGKRPDRVITAGKETRNVGIQSVSARRSPATGRSLEVAVRVTNGGTVTESRDVAVAALQGESWETVARWPLVLAAAESKLLSASVPDSARIAASLTPGDALATDDRQELDLRPLARRGIAVDRSCPAGIAAAVRAHPALELADGSRSVAAWACGSSTNSTLPTIRLVTTQPPAAITGALQWSSLIPGELRASLDGAAMQTAGTLAPLRSADRALLSVGGVPLIARRGTEPPSLEVAIDLSAPQSGKAAHVPLLVNLLFEQLLGEPLLDAVVSLDRGPRAVMVTPASNLPSPLLQASVTAREGRWPDPVPMLLAVALAVLVWELTALVRLGRGPSPARLDA